MKTKHQLLALFFSVTLALLSACKGEKGDLGPQGIQGERGATGQAGATGSANVIYGSWIDMSNATFWARNGIGFTASYAAPPISQEMLDRALILVYGRQEGRVILLPHFHNTLINYKRTLLCNAFICRYTCLNQLWLRIKRFPPFYWLA